MADEQLPKGKGEVKAVAKRQLFLPGALVRKSNDLIRGRINIENIDAARILASLISSLPDKSEEFREDYSISVNKIPGLKNFGGSGYAKLRVACDSLAKSTVTLERRNECKPDGDPIFEALTFFTRILYADGVVSAEFNPHMKKFLLGLRKVGYFTEYNLMEFMTLPSVYSQRMFEILKSYAGLPEKILEVSVLHDMLDITTSLKTDFAQFRRRVLEKAHKDITKETDLYYEWEPIKKGRSVEAVRFIFAQKRALPVAVKKEKKELQKQNEMRGKLFSCAVSCWKERGADCKGGHQKAEVCEVCLRLNSNKEKS